MVFGGEISQFVPEKPLIQLHKYPPWELGTQFPPFKQLLFEQAFVIDDPLSDIWQFGPEKPLQQLQK